MLEVVKKHFKVIDSTNTWAKKNAVELPRDKLTCVTADEQTGGRGRLQRRWESPPSQNIYASFCFFLDAYKEVIGNIPQVLALAVVQVLQKLEFSPKIKWPNDLLLSGKKVGGILCETSPVDGGLFVVVGVGINVNMPREELEKIGQPATSLLVETGKTFDRDLLLSRIEHYFVSYLDELMKKGFEAFLKQFTEVLVGMSKRIQFHDHQRLQEGILLSIEKDGSLNLKLDSGECKNYKAGFVVII
ncbi:MAG: biotin--[acetyl-CoA-carboxylase] ligase [Parachlamydiaceae bacterium]|nr:biotin--[acetyl-CoA-carboxylase] ligase [Parachlamydiaceae bacterium]